MDVFIAFWNESRNEVLTTLVCIMGIHLITNLGGFVKRVGGAKRVEGTGFKAAPRGTPARASRADSDGQERTGGS